MLKLVFDPVHPQKQISSASQARTLAERKAARLEMAKLSDRILSGFRSRYKYYQPRKATPEPWREALGRPIIDL
jgi:hypothetical protein